ncbi:hypothetical protein HMPREF1548_06801 [Clostridium sp. KLE 1755]|nr:hypothetical protein HMPREF1548_06801 [Clostridium sp. KLE 1755]
MFSAKPLVNIYNQVIFIFLYILYNLCIWFNPNHNTKIRIFHKTSFIICPNL